MFFIFLPFLTTVLADVIVTVPDGSIRGVEILSVRNHTYYAFLQIPYAEPPLGALRFQNPQPAKSWSGILNATEERKMCYQKSSNPPLENEDCLYLNVYTPVNPNKGTNKGNRKSRVRVSRLPVMVFIHGGGFVDGNSLYGMIRPDYFMENGVLIVTMSYRLGAFGFLSTGDSVSPGNYGLKDQNMALKWIQSSISCFGGDPSKVTIFGQSSGGVSVGYHVVSKQSKGLFRAAIQQSGGVLTPHGYQRRARDFAYALAKFIDPNFSDSASSQDLVDFLRNVTAKEIDAATEKFTQGPGTMILSEGSWFAPVIEQPCKDAFIIERMYESLEKGNINKVPLMIGMTSEEALLQAKIPDFNSIVEANDNNPSFLVQADMHITDPTNKTRAGEEIRRIYTDGQLKDNLAAAIKFSSDAFISRPVIKQARMQSPYSDVYFYQFSYDGPLGGNDFSVEGADRVSHSEDLRYLWVFNETVDVNSIDAKDLKTLNRYLRMYTNFAKTLNPTPEQDSLLDRVIWPKVTSENFQYLDIDEELTIKTDPKEPAYTKWVDIYNKWGIPPFDTY